MANTIFKLRRSSVAGKAPNTSTLSIGELAINLTDRKLYSSDGTNIFETGSNLTSLSVFSDIKIGNSSVNSSINSTALAVKSIVANGGIGTSGQVLSSNGTATYWAPSGGTQLIKQQYTANGSQTDFTVTGGYTSNNLQVYLNGVLLRNGLEANVESGNIFTISPAPANGSLIDVYGISSLYANGVSSVVSQQFTANGTANSFTITNGYLPNQLLVFLNGVKQDPSVDVDISSGNTVNFVATPANGFIVDVYGYQTSVSYYSNNLIVGNVSIGTSTISVGNSSVNTQIIAGNVFLNGSTLVIGNTAANVTVNNTVISVGSNVSVTTSSVSIGNSTVNAVVNSSVLSVGGNNISPVQSFRNKIINGNFDYWQRGTSNTSIASEQYLADRWQHFRAGSTANVSLQSFTVGQTDVPNEPTYFHRTVVTSSAGAGNYCILSQPVESVRTLAGQTATLSFWAKADASKNMAVEFAQIFGSGGSPSSSVFGIGVTTCALTTSWKKFTTTVNIPSISGKTLGTDNDHSLEFYFWFDAGSDFNSRTNSLGQQSGTFDIAQVQLEAGSVATPFEMRPLGVELALCQRYYNKSYSTGVDPGTNTLDGTYRMVSTAGTAWVNFDFPVEMRVAPTITPYNSTGTSGVYGSTAGNWTPTATYISTRRYSSYGGLSSNYFVYGHYVASAEL